MRLINTRTLQLEEFDYPATPPYAILSHTWGDGELTYQDIQTPGRISGKGSGYMKLEHTARQAKTDGLNYCWIDTCCINKANYSELSEAINSMYNWYKEAHKCYAYLADAEQGNEMSFRRSRWFTRGWTLQELLAPKEEVLFFDRHWQAYGFRSNLPRTISEITLIPQAILLGATDVYQASVAERMSWVSRRQTTKPEDMAYCLMGLFAINMPLLYGEREASAFKRLQMEIMKESNDMSIFAWATSRNGVDAEIAENQAFALLASSPRLFDDSHDVVQADMPVAPGYVQGIRTAMVFNNKGLHLALPLSKPIDGLTPAILACKRRDRSRELLAIWLRDVSANGGRYVRVRGYELSRVALVTIMQDFEFRMISTETWKFSQRSRVLLNDFLYAGVEKEKATERISAPSLYRYQIQPAPASQPVSSRTYQTFQSINVHESTAISSEYVTM